MKSCFLRGLQQFAGLSILVRTTVLFVSFNVIVLFKKKDCYYFCSQVKFLLVNYFPSGPVTVHEVEL